MAQATPPTPSPSKRGRSGPRGNRRSVAEVGLILLLTVPVLFLATASGAPTPVSYHSDVQSVLAGAVHVNTQGPSDIEVFDLTIKPAGSTVWHSHTGPLVVSVKRGTAALYRADATGCTRHVVKPGEAFLETPGEVHAVRNEGRGNLVLYAVSILPKGSDPGQEAKPPANCMFKALSSPGH